MGDIDQVLANLKEWANWLDADIGRNEPAGTQLREAATLITSLREARAEIAALVPDDRDPMDDTDNQAGFRNAINHALQIIDAALNPSRKETGI
jgi:hypothetical protein